MPADRTEAAEPDEGARPETPHDGPVPIDPALLHLISGGGPKGTWLSRETGVELGAEGPKGTW
jgi:hypothetical protein